MPSANIEQTTPFTTYTMRVQAENLVGKGGWSSEASGQFNFNKAEGGTIKDFGEGEYNGLEGTWRTHTFTGSNKSEKLTIFSNPRDFYVLVQAGGGGSGGFGNNGNNTPGYGGGGEHYYNEEQRLDVKEYFIIFGANAGAGQRGQSVNLDGVKSCVGGSPGGSGNGGSGGSGGGGGGGGGCSDPNANGGARGNGGAGANGCGNGGNAPGWGGNPNAGGGGGAGGSASGHRAGNGQNRTISGENKAYGTGGGVYSGVARAYGHGGGGGMGWSGGGAGGCVIIAYRTG